MTISSARLAVLLLLATATALAQRVCDATRYGAEPDGATKNTRTLQAANDDCASHGGGAVRLAGGTFDILVYKDHDLTMRPLAERREIFRSVLTAN